MSPAEASRVHVLYRSYVGSGPISLTKLHAVIRRECKDAGPRVTPGRMTELRADRAYVGRLWNRGER